MSATQEATIEPHGRALVPLELQIIIPEGHYGRIAPRSGLALQQIHVGAGVIDEDYRGAVSVVLYNLSPDKPYTVKRGQRIAQLILEKISTPDLVELVGEDVVLTARGEGGFGSTGL